MPAFHPAARLAAVPDPVIPEVAALLAARPGGLSLAQGMVAWGPPPAVAEAVGQALAADDPGLHRYGPLQGDDDLRAAISAQLQGQLGLDLSGTDLIVTAGSNMAFQAVVQVLCDPGDEVILPLPWYFNHAMAVQLAGGVPVPVQAGLVPDPDLLAAAITPRTRAIVTISPNNPSGVVTPPAVLAAINRLCAARGLVHISDEAYAAFVHGDVPHRSPGALAGSGAHTITLHSLSKAYGMAGWRLGWASVPCSLRAALTKVLDTDLICAPRLSQRAAVAALAAGDAWCRPHVADLGERRHELLAAVAAARSAGQPLELLAEPDGAFYALLAFPTPLDGLSAMRRLVGEHGVAALPGESFGLPSVAGRVVLRLSYGMLGSAALAEALGRLFAGCTALARG
jgi:aspartate/methionine/tyrosine aminotransferase